MAEVKGGYLRPTTITAISSSHAGHKNRTPPSQEPGTDYPCAYGSNVMAAEDGTIVDLSYSTSGGTGRYITIDLADGRRVRYLHLSQVLGTRGQKVKRGQVIAKSGASGFGREWGYGAHVHVSLWDGHRYAFGPNGTMDFAPQVGNDNDGPTFNQDVANRQAWLNQSRGEKLVIDGLYGPSTKAAITRYQNFLNKRYGTKLTVDGIWGNETQKVHQRYWNEYHAKPTNPKYHVATVKDLKDLKWVNGLQKIAKLYGYNGPIDNIWGPGSEAGLQAFLNQNYGGSLAAWLRAKWGYRDRDDLWGPNMKAAAARAEAANFKALK